MILTISIYEDGDQDKFQVHAVDPANPDQAHDVTGDYQVAAIDDPLGRDGFAVLRKHISIADEEGRDPTRGVEL